MRQILLLGIGQTGSTVAEKLLAKLNNSENRVTALAIDTDESSLSSVAMAEKVFMTDEGTLGDTVAAIGEDALSWFPCDFVADNSMFIKPLDMKNGANLWRMKALLAFNSFLTKEDKLAKLHAMLERILSAAGEEGEIDLYTVASLSGGTGSGLFLPVALYVKQYLERKGGHIAMSEAFLAMPDIYKNVLFAERGKKSYANAYAALRELNAVDFVANSPAEAAVSCARPPIDFKITLSRGAQKTLFDAACKEFHTPDVAPFHKVTLFEAVPTLNSVSEHIDVMTDVIFFACDETSREKLDSQAVGTVFGGQSLTCVRYPVDSVVEYITKQQLSLFASREFGFVVPAVEQHFLVRKMNAKNERRRFFDGIVSYRDSYMQTVEDRLEACDNLPESLIGRKIDLGVKLTIPEDLYRSADTAKIDSLIEQSVWNEDFACLKKFIDEVETEAPAKRIPDATQCREVLSAVETVKPRLSNAFLRAQAALADGEADFIASLLSFDEAVEFSIPRDVLCENGHFLHPVYALFRLCLLHKALEGYKNAPSLVPSEPRENYPFPKEIMLADMQLKNGKGKRPQSKYFKYGEYRFRDLMAYAYGQQDALAEVETKKTGKDVVADDKAVFLQDFKTVYVQLLQGIKQYRYLSTLALIEKLIARYRSLFNGIFALRDEVAAEVTLASVCGTTGNATLLNVAASQKEKDKLYQSYATLYNEDVESMLANDQKIAAQAASLACADVKNDIIAHDDVRRLFEKVSDIYLEHIKATDFYKANLQKDIIAALQATVIAGNDLSLEEVFATRYNPVKTCLEDVSDKKNEGAVSQILLSSRLEQKILVNPAAYDNMSPAEYVQDLFGAYVEYNTAVSFLPSIDETELYISVKREFPSLSSVIFCNESFADRDGFVAYKESLYSLKKHGTHLWNPSLIYTRESTTPLPFISPKKQKQYERQVAMAVLRDLLHKEIFLAKDEDGKKAYFWRDGFDSLLLVVDDKPVREGDVAALMLWAYQNESHTEKSAQDYLSCRDLDPDALCALMMKLLLALDRREALSADGYAGCLAEVAYSAFRIRYLDRNGAMTERSAADYVRDLRKFFEGLQQDLGTEQAQRYVKWLNAQGLFMDYADNGTFCEFAF